MERTVEVIYTTPAGRTLTRVVTCKGLNAFLRGLRARGCTFSGFC